MGAFVDLTGRVFGELTVISRAENHGKNTMWLCSCSCGKTKVVAGSNLRSGSTKSCGCRQSDAILKYNEKNAPHLEGKRFGQLTVLSRHYPSKRKNRSSWDCLCTCGKSCVVCGEELVRGDTKSCGCLHDKLFLERVTSHGLSRVGKRDPRYARLHTMMTRCYNKNQTDYKDYGGRGIKVCFEWNTFDNPNALDNWLRFCDETGFHDGLTIERKDVNGDYTPDNCEWVTRHDQSLNTRRTIRLKNGRSLTQVCVELGLFTKSTDNHNLYQRIIHYYRRHETLPKEVIDAAIHQNKQHLLEGV